MKQIFLNILNQDYITNIYIGITGIIIAIVIFIAESTKNQDNELKKRVILHYSKVKKNILTILGIFAYMLISNSLKYNEDIAIKSFNNIFYIVTHVILLMSAIYCIIITGRMSFVALKLNSEKSYMNKKIAEYMYSRAKILEKKEINKILNKEKKDLNTFIEKQSIFVIITSNEDIDKNYIPIYPKRNGIVKSYNYEKLIEIINMYEKEKEKEKFYIKENKVVLIFDKIGKKIYKSDPVFYCLDKYKKVFENINEVLIYEEQEFFINDEINLINSSLFEKEFKYNQLEEFDENDMIYNYFDFLYKNNLERVKQLAIQEIEKYYRKVDSDYNRNKQFCIFLDKLANLIRKNDDFINYEKIITFEYYLYIEQLENKNSDTKEITYNFANLIISYNLFFALNNEYNRYYEFIMNILFKFLMNLLKIEKYEEINILLNNILIEERDIERREFNKQDIIKFQFSIGIIISFIVLDNENKLKEENKNTLKIVLDYFGKELLNLYDCWEVISNFKKYFGEKTSLQNTYENLEMYFGEPKYKNSWSVIPVDKMMILKEYIYLNNIDIINKNRINYNEITKEDKRFYSKLSELIKDEEQTEIEKIFGIKYESKEKLKEFIDLIVEEADRKEKEYNRTNSLNIEKINEFKKEMIDELNKETEFIKFLNENDKIKKTYEESKKVYGIDQLISREFFFDSFPSYTFLIEHYKTFLDNLLKTEYINKIEEMSKIEKKSFNEVIKKLENIEEYVIITNFMNYKTLEMHKYERKSSTIVINNKRINVFKISKVNGFYLIKKSDLPNVYIADFYKKKWNKQNIKDNIYFELEDCSEKEDLRKEMLAEFKWTKEKGDEQEQDNYLKENCRLRIYKAFIITKNCEASAIKIKNEY